jgi:hypothetical protein
MAHHLAMRGRKVGESDAADFADVWLTNVTSLGPLKGAMRLLRRVCQLWRCFVSSALVMLFYEEGA